MNYVDIDPLFRESDLTKWNSLLLDQLEGTDAKADIQQQLLHERQRLSSTKGVTMYLVTENRLIYQSHGKINYTDNMTDPGQMKRCSLTAGVIFFELSWKL